MIIGNNVKPKDRQRVLFEELDTLADKYGVKAVTKKLFDKKTKFPYEAWLPKLGYGSFTQLRMDWRLSKLDDINEEDEEFDTESLINADQDTLIEIALELAEAGPVTLTSWKKAGYSDTPVIREFGSFSAMLSVAGIKPGPTSSRYNLFKKKIALAHKYDKYIDTQVMRWVDSAVRPPKNPNFIEAVVISDAHGLATDLFVWNMFIATITIQQPDIIILAGDMLNFGPVSRHRKNPNRHVTLQSEIDFFRKKMLADIREACPDSQLDLILGNHEMWLVKYIAEQAPGLASLRCLDYSELLGLEEHSVNLVFDNTITGAIIDAATHKEAYLQNSKIYHDTFLVTHGTKTGITAAYKELLAMAFPGCSGHLHSPSLATRPTIDRPYAEWFVLPMAASLYVNEEYRSTVPNPHTRGFGAVTIVPKTKTHFFRYAHVRGNMGMIDGLVFQRSNKTGVIRVA